MSHSRTHDGTDSYSLAVGFSPDADVVCFSHLRWDFVFQRPQHLMTRFARRRRVLFVEEPLPGNGKALMEVLERDGVTIARPRTPTGIDSAAAEALVSTLVTDFVRGWVKPQWIAWYYTPMALGLTASLEPTLVVYDCMDELSAFRDAPPALLQREAELLRDADVVFTGGLSLYEAKRRRHGFVLPFPSSIDAHHFRPARDGLAQPEDQLAIPTPRLGFIGVLDERFDAGLLADVASARPDWHFVLIGPVVKIDPAVLPQAPNIHYLGQRRYEELPGYLAGWDVALMPFALNDSTRFISPTKTPEYLAAGRPVVSTPITDVVRTYGAQGLVEIAATADEFVNAIERALAPSSLEARAEWLARVDQVLASTSWDMTWMAMEEAMEHAGARALVAAPGAAGDRERIVPSAARRESGRRADV